MHGVWGLLGFASDRASQQYCLKGCLTFACQLINQLAHGLFLRCECMASAGTKCATLVRMVTACIAIDYPAAHARCAT